MTARRGGGRPALPRKRTAVLALAALLLVTGMGGCGADDGGAAPRERVGANAPTEVVDAAWLNQGAVVEDTWTAAHERGRQAVDRALGDSVRTHFVEHVVLGPEVDSTIDRLVGEGIDIVFATSVGFSPFLAEAARRHPEVHFEQARGATTLDNLGTFGGADEEPLYLAGMAAAGASKTDVIGFVGTVPEPETIRHVDAFTLGARSVEPEITVRLAWMGSWYDPDREVQLGRALAEEGAGVLVSGSVTSELGEVARDHGIGWVGHDADWSSGYPDTWITAAVPDWGPFYVRQVRATIDGTWSAAAYYGALSDGFTDLATLGERVPAEIRERVLTTREAILDGRLDVFTGPVVDTTGRMRADEGNSIPLPDRLTIDWYVQGVDLVDPPTHD